MCFIESDIIRVRLNNKNFAMHMSDHAAVAAAVINITPSTTTTTITTTNCHLVWSIK